MASAYYYNQQQGGVPSMPQRGIPGQMGMNPIQGQYIQQQQQQQQQQQAYRNQAINDTLRKRAHNKAIRQNAPAAEEPEEPSGDELDDISARDIAMARYKRNHDYLSEIFTPYNAAAITPASLEFSQTKEEYEKQIAEYNERSVKQKREHEERLVSLDKTNEEFWKLLNELNKAESLETIDMASEKLAKELNVKIEHTTQPFKVLSIPGIEDDLNNIIQEQKSPEQQENVVKIDNTHQQENQQDEEDTLDLYFNDKAEDEGNDSFFNDLVNTDDDPSVNEYLNTE